MEASLTPQPQPQSKQPPLRRWPQRVFVEQGEMGTNRAQIFDADTGELQTAVFEVLVGLTRKEAEIIVTMAKHDPFKRAVDAGDGEEHCNGIVVESRRYVVETLRMEGRML